MYDFPTTPTPGDAYAGGGSSYMWNGTLWERGVGVLTPFINSLVPDEAPVNDATVVVRVLGGNFINTSVVRFDSVDQVTTFVSATELTVTAPLEAYAKVADVDVTHLGITSNPVEFTYVQPAPFITSLLPNQVPTNQAGQVVVINGGNFTAQSVVYFDGVILANTFVDAGELTITVPSYSVADSVGVTVVDGALTSNTAMFNYLLKTMWLDAIVPNNAPHAYTNQVEVHFIGRGFVNGVRIIMGQIDVSPSNFLSSGDVWTYIFPSTMSGGTPVPPNPSTPKPGVVQCYLWNSTTGESTNMLPFTYT